MQIKKYFNPISKMLRLIFKALLVEFGEYVDSNERYELTSEFGTSLSKY